MKLSLPRAAVVAVILMGSIVGLAACDSYNDERGRGDSPVGNRVEEPRTVIFNVDRYPNLSIICDGSTALYTNTRDAGNIAVVPNSEHCPRSGNK